jgi:hypothetical protein
MKKTPKKVLDIVRSAMAEPLLLPLSAGVPIYEYDGRSLTGARNRWTVTLGTAPGWRTSDTCRVLKAKVKRAWEADQKSEPEFCGLAGKTLKNGMGASSVSVENSADDPYSAPALSTHYVLVLSNREGPVGFCAFAVNLELIDRDELIGFEIEVLEIFVEPTHRDRCHSHDFCVVVAQFAINAVEEFNDRLYKGGARFAEGVTLNIVGDVESRSGERFLFSIKKELERREDDSRFEDDSLFELSVGLCIEQIKVDPRW